jgi:septal ring factor EnvC (AmiA/AmiB activator)
MLTTGCRIKAGILFRYVILVLLLCSVNAPLLAEPRKAAGDDAARRAQYLLRQMQAELQKARTENARLQSELDALARKHSDTAAQLEKTEGRLSSSNTRNMALKNRLLSDGDKYRELMNRYRKVLGELRKAQFMVAYMEEAVVERNDWIQTCRASNEELYTVNTELLAAYENKGLIASLSRAVPVTGLAMVRDENIVEEYRYRLEDLKVIDFNGKPGVESALVGGSDSGG